ncbi:MAG TPA: hypothetical protein IAA57_05130 [Candidatus Pullilachnospira intestinigallinarum]|nr:hypothetical protein [Candidatus Pullilachnospira intestinigallinarum]
MKNKKWKRSGALTVEASVLFGTLCIVMGILISLTIHVYRRAWYTAAACETVLTGSGRGVLKGTEGSALAQRKWEERKGDFFPEPEDFFSWAGGGEKNVQVQVQGSTVFWGCADLSFCLEKEMKILRPVTFVRQAAAWKEGGD